MIVNMEAECLKTALMQEKQEVRRLQKELADALRVNEELRREVEIFERVRILFQKLKPKPGT